MWCFWRFEFDEINDCNHGDQVMEGLNLGDLVGQPYGTHRHYSVCFNDFLDCCMSNLCLLVYSRVRITGHSLLPHLLVKSIYAMNSVTIFIWYNIWSLLQSMTWFWSLSDAICILILSWHIIQGSFFHIKWFCSVCTSVF